MLLWQPLAGGGHHGSHVRVTEREIQVSRWRGRAPWLPHDGHREGNPGGVKQLQPSCQDMWEDKLCSLFVVFFLKTYLTIDLLLAFVFSEMMLLYITYAISAQGINHGLRTRSCTKNIYVLIVLKAWHSNWKFKGQKCSFVFPIFQEIKRPTMQRLIEIHFPCLFGTLY